MLRIDSNKLKKRLYVLVYVIVAIVVLVKGPEYYPDSYAFFNMSFNRSPIYSLFLKFFTSVFGLNYEWPIVIIQYGIIVFGVHYFVKWLGSIFKLSVLEICIIQIVLLSPCFHWYFIANRFLSSALCYPLVLIIFTLGLKAFVKLSLRPLLLSVIPLFLVVLTRGQFLVIIPVYIVLGIYIAYIKKMKIKQLLPLLLLVLLPMLTSVSERIYNKTVFGYFENNAMNYVHLIAANFYLSESKDVHLFNDKDEITFFKIVNGSLERKGLTQRQAIERGEYDYEVYQKNFWHICNARVQDLGLLYFKNKGLGYYEQNIELNKLCKSMLFKMLKHDYSGRLSFFYKGLKNAFGSSKQLFLFLILLVYSLFKLIKTNKSIYKFIILATVLMLANHALIAFVVHTIKRYLFYYNWVIFVVVILLLNLISKNERNVN